MNALTPKVATIHQLLFHIVDFRYLMQRGIC